MMAQMVSSEKSLVHGVSWLLKASVIAWISGVTSAGCYYIAGSGVQLFASP